ncbi:hypothetical protein PENTCL1PPCAC_4610, partial [Pristionchus entomophagus]
MVFDRSADLRRGSASWDGGSTQRRSRGSPGIRCGTRHFHRRPSRRGFGSRRWTGLRRQQEAQQRRAEGRSEVGPLLTS